MSRKYQIDMRRGPLLKQILVFTIPLMLTGFLQLLYNAVDIIIIGKFDGTVAQGAVSSTSQLINLFVSMFMGIAAGSSVVASRAAGASDVESVDGIVHTSIALSLILGIILAAVGVIFSNDMLKFMSAPDETIELSTLYLTIFFLGMPANMVYNFGSSLLRSMGDTKRPLYFLLISGAINLTFNILFVAIFKWGVAGVAIATVIAQFTSMILVIITLANSPIPYKLMFSRIKIDVKRLIQILKVGLPLGVQGSLFAVSNVLIQSSVNSFNSATILAGVGTSNNLDTVIFITMNAFYQTCLNFTSQNLGGMQYHRMRKVYHYCLGLVFLFGLAAGTIVTFGSPFLLRIFTDDPAVIAIGTERLYYIALPMFLCGIMDVTSGQLRGIGYSLSPTIISLTFVCLLRIVWIATVFNHFGTLVSLYLSYPISWAIAFVILFIVYAIGIRKFPNENKELPD